MGYRLVGVLLFGGLVAGCSESDEWPAKHGSYAIRLTTKQACAAITVLPFKIGNEVMVKIPRDLRSPVLGWMDEGELEIMKSECGRPRP